MTCALQIPPSNRVNAPTADTLVRSPWNTTAGVRLTTLIRGVSSYVTCPVPAPNVPSTCACATAAASAVEASEAAAARRGDMSVVTAAWVVPRR